MAQKEVWFRYTQVAERFSAWPVHWKGWLALLALLAGPIAFAYLVQGWVERTLGDAGSVALVVGTFLVIFPSIYVLARVKGEKAKR